MDEHNREQAMFHTGNKGNNSTPSPGRVEKNVHSPWTAPRDRKKHRRGHSSGLTEVDEEALQQGAPWRAFLLGVTMPWPNTVLLLSACAQAMSEQAPSEDQTSC